MRLKQPERVARLRGKSVAEITGVDEKKGGARRVHEAGPSASTAPVPVPAPAEPPAGA